MDYKAKSTPKIPCSSNKMRVAVIKITTIIKVFQVKTMRYTTNRTPR
jgi:hypothetical protein